MWLRLYPGAWRRRYGDEMEVLLETRPPNTRERLDLVRGAADAWLHPVMPSRVPALAALIGGGLWTAIAAGVLTQATQPDWPGYIFEVLVPAAVAAAFLLLATVGCALRTGDSGGRVLSVAVLVAVVGHIAWIVLLLGTVAARVDAASLAAAQTVGMIGTALIGLVLVRSGDLLVGSLMLVGSTAMLIPSTLTWIVLGVAWNAVGWVLLLSSRGSGATLRPT